MNLLITKRQQQIEALCRQHYVHRLALFGSALRDDFDPASSDVDLLIEFGEMPPQKYFRNYFDLLDAFTQLFGRKVDLVIERGVKNPYLRREIESTQQVLYAA
ncbi:MAG: nucleotidyltransferase domain-containing protein [Granulicella sp.]